MSASELDTLVTGAALAASFLTGLVLGNNRRRNRLLHWLTAGSFVREVSVDSERLYRLDAVLVQVEVKPGSRLIGVEVDELRLPAGAAVSLLARGERVFVPEGRTTLRAGDQALVVTARDRVQAVAGRLRAVSRHGRLADWYEKGSGE